jgi:hypothetical protein
MADQLQRLKDSARSVKQKAEERLRKGSQDTKQRTRQRLQQARAQAIASAKQLGEGDIGTAKRPDKSPAERANEEARMAPPIDASLHPTSSIETMDQFAAGGGGQPAEQSGPGQQQSDVEPMESFASIGVGGRQDQDDEEIDDAVAMGVSLGEASDDEYDDMAGLGFGFGGENADEDIDEVDALGLGLSDDEEDQWGFF